MSDKQLPMAVSQGTGLQITNVDELQRTAKLMLASGIFNSADDPNEALAQACVKIIAGQEYGLTPFKAMKSIHVFEGEIQLSYQLIAALIKRSGKYKFKVLESTNEIARIEFFEKNENGEWESLGEVKFDTADATTAKLLTKHNWQKHPKTMRFARCLTLGANMHCSDVFSGPIYSEADFGQDDEKKPSRSRRQSQSNQTVTVTSDEATSSESAGTTASQTTSGTTSATPVADVTDVEEVKDAPKSEPAPGTAAAEPAATTEDAPAAAGATNTPDVAPPGEPQLGEILQAAISNGWSEEQCEGWVVEYLMSAGVNCESTETIFKTWTWDHVQHAVNHVLSNKPQG